MVQSNQNWYRREGLPSAVSQIMKQDSLFWLFATAIGHCTDTNKAVHCFHMFTSAFCIILVQAILQDYSSLFMHKTSKERYRTHTSNADTGVLQTLCVDSALRLRGHKRYMQSKKDKFCMQYCKPRYLSTTDKNRPTPENANFETFAISAFSLLSLDSNW